MSKWPYVLLVAGSISASLASAPVIDDFAFRAEIAPASQALQHLDLPLELLLNVTRADLGDIAVFDADGKTLPHLIRKPPAQVLREQIELQFHAFDSFHRQNAKIVTIREQNQQDGKLSEKQTTETIENHLLKQDYLIELPGHPRVNKLELNWTQEPANQLLQVKLEVGNELDKLRTFDQRKTLSNLNPDTPEWRLIKNIPQNQKYLRITAPDNIKRFELLQVIGHYQKIPAKPKLWHEVELSRQTIDNIEYQSFDSPSAAIPGALRIVPRLPHSSISGSLYASKDEFRHKRRIRSYFQQHNITSSEVKPNQPIRLPNQHYQHWWITLEPQTDQPPKLEFAYPLSELLFLGNGNSPYSLAWGNYLSQGQTSNLARLLDSNLSQSENRGVKTNLVSIRSAGGPGRLTPETKLPWKKWLLWMLLVLAAVITGGMAIGLYREMNQ